MSHVLIVEYWLISSHYDVIKQKYCAMPLATWVTSYLVMLLVVGLWVSMVRYSTSMNTAPRYILHSLLCRIRIFSSLSIRWTTSYQGRGWTSASCRHIALLADVFVCMLNLAVSILIQKLVLEVHFMVILGEQTVRNLVEMRSILSNRWDIKLL